MKDFSLKQGQGLMAKAAHLYPKFPSVLSPTPFPSPPPPPINRLMQRANTGFDFLNQYWANKLVHIS